MHIRPFSTEDEPAVVALWQRCGLLRSWNDPSRDIARKLAVQAEWFLVVESESGDILGSAMVGYDGHRGWINYLAVDPRCQGQGIGRQLMARAEQVLRDAGCPKLNLQVRDGNRAAEAFYRSLGYQVDEVISFGKRLIPDTD
ncbi:MAG: GNAT family acetyltransferase [Pseudomonadota bacterium]